MPHLGSILIADDEETFRESTCRLLQREGFECHCAKDVDEALDALRSHRFDVLMADIRMPRNADLRMVREARELDSQMPIILVTGYPSTETAIQSLDLSVKAYLTKPVDYDELISRLHKTIENSRNRRRLAGVHRRLESCLADLEHSSGPGLPQEDEANRLVAIATIRTLASCLSDLLELRAPAESDPAAHNLCELLDCPQQPLHRQAISRTVQVLKETKNAFKSKALAELRVELEGLFGSLD